MMGSLKGYSHERGHLLSRQGVMNVYLRWREKRLKRQTLESNLVGAKSQQKEAICTHLSQISSLVQRACVP